MGIGGKYDWKRCELGLFSDYAHFTDVCEFATELSLKVKITENIFIQPTVHFIVDVDDSNSFNTVGMLRLGIRY